MSKVILYIIGVFFVISGIDYILGNPMKLGEKFEEGIKTMGAVGLAMVGLYSLAPILSNVLSKIFVPVAQIFNLDPSIFPASLFAVDMGGYQLCKNLALNEQMGLFSGIIVTSTLGATISFTIPLAIGIISKEDMPCFSRGIMAGISTIPFGCLAGGLYQGIDFYVLCWNLFPVFIFSIMLVMGLLFIPKSLIKVFNIFGKSIVAVSIIGLLLQGIYIISDIKLVSNLASFSEIMSIVGKIAFVLGGAFPMLEVINRIFKEAFEKIGCKMGINSASVGGILGNLASNLLIFGTYKEMNSKGKVVCTALAVSGAFVFGGQLGFISGLTPEMMGPFIISKFVGSILSIFLASWIFEREVIQSSKYKV